MPSHAFPPLVASPADLGAEDELPERRQSDLRAEDSAAAAAAAAAIGGGSGSSGDGYLPLHLQALRHGILKQVTVGPVGVEGGRAPVGASFAPTRPCTLGF